MELSPGVYHIEVPSRTLPPAKATNSYLIGAVELTLIDVPRTWDTAHNPIARELERRGSPPLRRVLFTHSHMDHYEGVDDIPALAGAALMAHPVEGRVISANLKTQRVEHDLQDGDRLRADGITIRALFTPGHAPGHLCYYLEEPRFLISGDVILGFGTSVISPPQGDMSEYLATLERLKQLDLAMILPAHGPMIRDPYAKIQEYIEHRLRREAKVLDAVRQGHATPERIARAIYGEEDFRVHGYDLLPRAARMVLAHLLKLEREGRIHRTAGARVDAFAA
ncbi:MAG: MBL fold metallo-hydrolase [Candidatus Tectomicrobia bacterium]|nr:MBL fold metallo-hydrolase [Candidatus Tectomicrobia bacterium]